MQFYFVKEGTVRATTYGFFFAVFMIIITAVHIFLNKNI
jgi:hypothetical protein